MIDVNIEAIIHFLCVLEFISSTVLLDLIQVLEQLFYFIRHPGATITEKTFNKVVQCGSVRGEPVKRFLHDLTWLHAPAVVLSTFWDNSKKDQHHHHMNDFLTFLSGVSVSEENSGETDTLPSAAFNTLFTPTLSCLTFPLLLTVF